MIKDILLPEKFGDYSLFSQRIIGIDIGKTHVHATQVYARSNSVTIEQVLEEKMISNTQPHPERTVAALQALFGKLSKPDRICTALPSSSVVFKELKLPFTSTATIAQVIKFEVEPLLPFPLYDAIVDCIITKQMPEQNSSEVLVAAVQKQVVAQHLALFEQAGVNPDIITVDIFALYGLYQQIPAYATQPGITILIDLGAQATRLALISDGQLRIIRTIPYGIHAIAKDVNSAIDASPQQALDHLLRFGLEQGDADQIHQATINAVTAFMHRVQFALTSMVSQADRDKKVNQILLLGDGATLKGIIPFISDFLQIPCSVFNASLITANKRYHVKNNLSLTPTALISLGAALPVPLLEQFNLRKDEFGTQDSNLLLKQLTVCASLIALLFIALVSHSMIQTRRLSKELRTSEQEAVDSLKEQFPSIDEDDLEEVITAAKNALAKEEQTWLAFTSQSRRSFLEYLLELSTRINKQELGFIPEQLTIIDGAEAKITLKAKVRDFEALKKFEQTLRESKMFSYVEGQKAPEFTMKILVARKEVL